jgi:hypothetical protein
VKVATYLILMAIFMVATWSDNLRDVGMMILGALVWMLVVKAVRS